MRKVMSQSSSKKTIIDIRKLQFSAPLLILIVLLNFSCKNQSISDFQIFYENQTSNLTALNLQSKSNYIKSTNKKAILAYGFSQETQNYLENEHAISLQIQLETNGNPYIEFFLLDENDILKNPKRISSSNSIKGNCQTCTLSLLIPKNKKAHIKGFALSCTKGEAKIHSAQFVSAKIGWSYAQNIPWFAYNEKGGKIPQSKAEAQKANLDFSSAYAPLDRTYAPLDTENKIYFALSNTKTDYNEGKGYRVQFKTENQILNFYPKKQKHNEEITTKVFSSPVSTFQCILGSEFVDAVIFDVKSTNSQGKSIVPIKTDCGLIQNWPQKNWRQTDFEIFEWSDFPGVLIFDFANYKIQDAFLKRLAFFTEKEGFVGTLANDEDIKDKHGYNAHDYKAQSLADFFEMARIQNFPLNESEKVLQQILFESGVIVKSTNPNSEKIRAGQGAVISISQESPAYLRTLFLCHEGMHGVFFVDSDFRRFVYELYDKTDSNSVEFLKAYFTVTPSLNYNIDDEYLLKNEFMAYLIQQPLSSTEKYFSESLATRYYINRENPELANYIKETKASGLVESASKLDKYIFERWNFNLGRTWNISVYNE